MKSKQKGFSVLIVLLVVVVIGVAAGTAYYVLKKNSDVATDSSASAKQTNKDEKATAPSTDKPDEVEYLTIKELNIKIRLTNEIKDLAAHVAKPNVAEFSLQSFVDASTSMEVLTNDDGTNSCRSQVSVGIVPPEGRKQLEDDPIYSYRFDSEGKPLDGQFLVQLADKRYARFTRSQSTCLKGGDNVEALRDRELEVRNTLLRVLPNNISSL